MKKIVKIGLMFSILLNILGNFSAGFVSAQESERDTLYIGATNTISGLNPLNSSDVVAQWVERFMYPSLMDQIAPGEFQANIADITTEDNLTYTIKIGDDVNWSDGQPVTADDIAYNISLIADPHFETHAASYITAIAGLNDSGKLDEGAELTGLTIVDDKTLTITLKEAADPAYVKENIGFKLLIAPKHMIEVEDIYNLGSSKFATEPSVFAGPYKFVKYENGAYVQLEANENYFRGEPKIKNVYIQFMDSTAIVTALQAGTLDMSAGGGIGLIPITDINALRQNESLFVEANPGTSGQFMHINNEVFTDENFRKALLTAINRDRLVTDLLMGEGEVIASTLTSMNQYKDSDLAPAEYDPEAAKALLEESGFDTSQEIVLSVPTGNVTRMTAANLIEQDLEAIGLNIRQETADFATHLAKVNSGDYHLAMIGLAFNVDPDQSSYWSVESLNYANINDEHLESLIAEGRALTSFDERYPVYQEFQAYFQDKAFVAPLYADYQFTIKTKKLDGGIKPFWHGSLYDIEQWTIAE
ncbi:ABC transporter substrate-binding protein [Aerococcaceae bacterium DSM 111022]|nr:ABC transporter substrate-binding protein [Aerococcaceae bacterium DSM 111022]